MVRRAGPEGRKSELLSVRLTPRVRYGLDLVARLHRETVPEVVARAVAELFTSEHGGLFVHVGDDDKFPTNLLKLVWADLPSDRLINLALRYPSVMTLAERDLWQRICNTPKYWRCESADTQPKPSEATILRTVVAEEWDDLNAKA